MIGKIEKTVYITGYWRDCPTDTFTNYKCYIGAEYEGEQDDALDQDVFYWFESQEDFEGFRDTHESFKNRGDSEFVITSFTE